MTTINSGKFNVISRTHFATMNSKTQEKQLFIIYWQQVSSLYVKSRKRNTEPIKIFATIKNNSHSYV